VQYDRELLEPDIDIGEFANQALSSGNTAGHQRRVARMGHDHKTDAIFFSICFAECFRNKSEGVSERKIKCF